MSCEYAHSLHRKYVNPDFVDILEAFDFGRCFVRTSGNMLYDDDGVAYLDLLAGYGVHNIGHNHPQLIQSLKDSLTAEPPSMLNVDAPAAQGELAKRLCGLIHPDLSRICFANSGAEAVEMALKTARVATNRQPIIACENAYHGLTTGALSLMTSKGFPEHFGSLLPEIQHIPFGDTVSLEKACKEFQPAAFIVEPIQAEGGIRIPDPTYLHDSRQICRTHDCLFIVDEIQTGLGRTGNMFATPLPNLEPDILLAGKALSGGIVPLAAAAIHQSVWKRAYAGPERCNLNASTFAGGNLAMTAGLSVLQILEQEGLCEKAAETGTYLLKKLAPLVDKHAIVKAVRGQGLLAGIEFEPAKGILMKAVPSWAREGLYAQVVSALLLRDHHILTQPCSLMESVLRVEPPLCITIKEVDQFISALDEVISEYPSHNSALKSAFRKTVLKGSL